MALYAIGDTHLSISGEKPMDIFGEKWSNHAEKLIGGFAALRPDDICVICGDISWAMSLDDAAADFLFLSALPGIKIILKGNHDYWWSTAAKAKNLMNKLGIKNIFFLHNNFFPYGENAAICGTRGWFYEEERGDSGRSGSESEHDKKIMNRELLRLEASLKLAGEREKYVFLHYPPKYGGYECAEILSLLREFDVKICCAGHIHSDGLRLKFEGTLDKTAHYMVSADNIDFTPKKILP